MPAVHETYPCHVCEKTHDLNFAGDDAPDLGKHFNSSAPRTDSPSG
jgi:hypothetical protein